MRKETDWVRCGCCGKDIPHDRENNVHFGMVPYPDDVGYGMCVECGGDKTVKPEKGKPLTEAQIRRKLGWAGTMFYDARISILEEKLRPELAEKFKAMPYSKKVAVVAGMIEKGHMI